MTTALFKISDGKNAWRARLERPNLADLQSIVSSKGIEPATLRYSWEGELLNLDSDDDLKEALLLAKEAGTNIIRILVTGVGVTGGDSGASYGEDDGSTSAIKNAHKGAALTAYFDEERKKWIFPGENQAGDSAPDAPPAVAAPTVAQTPGDGAAPSASSELPSSSALDGEAASKKERTKREKEAAAAEFITSVLRSLDEGDQRLDGLILTMMPGGSNNEGFKAIVEAYPNIFRSIPGPCAAFLRQFGGFSSAEFFTAGGCRQSARRCGQRHPCQREQAQAAAEAPPSKHFGGQEVSDFEMALQKAIEASLG